MAFAITPFLVLALLFTPPPVTVHAEHLALMNRPAPVASSNPPMAEHRGMGSNVEQWRPLVASHFPGSQVDRALCIIRAESGGNPGAKNPRSSARGLFQVLGSLWAPHYGISQNALYNPELNVSVAADIWRQSGWSAWSSSWKC